MLKHLFTVHPRSVGETYGEHLRVASGFGLALIGAGIACLLHGLLPFLFVRTGSETVRRLHQRMVQGRGAAVGGSVERT
ncbi:MAG TPA: DUF6356 family protein [Burkholderiales bacterium]|nr:DUF6356 family protein [Burkholderiales bacterium]